MRRVPVDPAADSVLPSGVDPSAQRLPTRPIPPHDDDACLHDLLAQQARRTPGAVVFDEQGRLTLAQLDDQAGRLAGHLRALGAGTGDVVGVCIQRSVDMVVALVAVLKAGAAFLPLDPGQPRSRLELMLGDAQPKLVLTRGRDGKILPAISSPVVDVDADRGTWMLRQPVRAADCAPHDLAYLLFTSGSTGTPKGVLVEHRSLVNHLRWRINAFAMTSTDRAIHKTPLGFDMALAELFAPLLCGASLMLMRPGDHADARRLVDAVAAGRLTMLSLVPSMLEAVLAESDAGQLASLRLVTCGGDTLKPSLVRAFFQRFGPGVQLHNMYGPTETVISAASWQCDPSDEGSIPIGMPVANTQFYVLDQDLVPVPQGTAGELCIGGAQVARGYLNQPGLTAERFVAHPTQPGERIYRTGDMVRVRSDGAVEFLGRSDGQVKIRGVRVELGEVEDVIARQPAVRSVVAAVRTDPRGEPRLVAYVSGRQGSTLPEPPDLLAQLSTRLPLAMVPSVIVKIDEIPLMDNGKIDVAALPTPDWALRSSAPFVAPRSLLEERLARLWEEALGRPEVGVDDNFLELGGHSLLAVRLLSEVEDELGVALELSAMFERGLTVAGMAILAEEAMARRQADPAPPSLPVMPRGDVGPAPLSAAEAQLWYFSQLAPEDPVYNEAFTLHKSGALDVAALQSAFNEVMRRHEILRSTFEWVDGEPMQVAQPHSPHDVPVVDLSGLPDERREAEAARLAADQASRPYQLDRGPLVRPCLVRLGPFDHRFELALHHLVFDGASIHIIASELITLYEAFSKGVESPLPEPDIQYADYAAWEAQWMESPAFAARIEYWRSAMSGLQRLEMPLDHPRPAVQSFRGAALRFDLPTDTVEQLRSLSRANDATLFQTLLASFAVLLHRYCRQDDLAFGTIADQRQRPELQSMVGYCATPLVLRNDVSDDPTFAELLARVRSGLVSAITHQVPFERLVRELRPPREQATNPLVQVVLSNLRTPAPLADTWSLSALEEERGDVLAEAKFDLQVELDELPTGGIRGRAIYNIDLFDETTVARLVDCWTTLLRGVTAAPAGHISELPILSPAERQLQVDRWNATEADFPRDSTLHDLIAAQAARTPDAVAVTDGVREISFADLDDRAGRLAAELRLRGVTAGALVGVCMDRSVDLVVALVAVLKSGGAYVPLEPDQPRERFAFVIGDARPAVTLTTAAFADRLPAAGTQTLVVDAHGASWAQHQPIHGRVDAGDLAYVLYTSGSTGKPKGVMIEHRAIVNQLTWRVASFGLGAGDRVLQKTPLGFDVSLWELFCPLISGATMILLEPGAQGDPRRIADTIRAQRVTALHFVPSMLQTFLAAVGADGCGTVRLVASSGEALNSAVVRRFRECFGPRVELRNLYGPTEAAVDVTSWPCDPGDPVVPIGRPVSNTRIYLLDDRLQLVPVGARAELCIGGVGLARGYLNRPDLTAERFVPDPFREGERIYRTGDLARYRPDGVIEYLGRNDDQVKIRGHRIELGEVSAALLDHECVAEAVVDVAEDPRGDPALVAYLVPAEGGRAPSHREMVDHLSTRLPAVMIPSAFMVISSVPVTANGKLDRRALPSPEWAPLTAERSAPPRSPVEEQLAQILARVLNVSRVGVDDNFFDLGGHSLLAVRLLSVVEHELGRALPLATFFRNATVAGMAEAFDAEPGAADGGTLVVPVQAGHVEPVLFFVHADESTMLTLRHFTGPLGPDQRIVGLLPERTGRRFDTTRTVADLAVPMLETIRSVQPRGPYHLAGFSFGGLLAYELASRLRADGEGVAWLALLDSMTPATSRRLMWLRSSRGFLTRVRERGILRASRKLVRLAIGVGRTIRQRGRRENDWDDFDWAGAAAIARAHTLRGNDCPVELFVSADAASMARDTTLGWRDVHRGPLSVREFPGRHLSIISEPAVHQVAELFTASLRRAQQADASPSS